MLIKFLSDYIKLEKELTDKFGEEIGQKIFESLTELVQLKIRTKSIIFELDLFKEIYIDKIFSVTENFYSSKLKKKHTPAEKELLDVVNEVLEKPKHSLSDEITLLFYVGLYHKIENYENEILGHYNILNRTNYKDLEKIGIDTKNKKKLFQDRDRLRLISNSIKHNRLFPKKELLKYYPYLRQDQKLSIKDFNPTEDIILVQSFIHFFNFLISTRILMETKKELEGTNYHSSELDKLFADLTEDIDPKEEEFQSTFWRQ
ncbi:hypothetical protein [Salegentibacter maritimus]|uniref:Cthe-2314-like HEPN domain-containing protein n=1 Tax=Salegentibacter maritimus TaxID=2794347 RepID=A0ABS0THK6_9FLAO|nr:hypothetical protein [Salegentibacter maritimus]MBI6120544.1 hypothetical protein [Salegentibacter maritimus]